MVLVILQFQNGRAFVPSVVKEWKLQPLDVIIYKDRKEVQYRYISERNLINLATYVGMGSEKPTGMNGISAQGAGLNMTVPAGGMGGRMGMPTYGSSLSKSATEEFEDYIASISPALIPTLGFIAYAQKCAAETTDFWKSSQELTNIINPAPINPVSRYNLIVKTDEGTHKLYTDRSEDPVVLSDTQLASVLEEAFPEPFERQQKAASYIHEGVKLLGNVMSREGNIRMSYSPDYLDTAIPEPVLPHNEGIVLFHKQVTYCNPKVTYLDGTPYSYALAVQPGRFTLIKELAGFHAINTPDGSHLTKEDLMPQAHPDRLMRGQVVTLYDGRDGTTTIPVKVLHVSRTPNNILIKVQPLFGPVEPVNILFYRGQIKKFDPLDPSVLLVPFVETQIMVLPRYAEEGFVDPTNSIVGEPGKMHTIVIQKGGGNLFALMEDNHYVQKRFDYGSLVYRLIRRYGFGDAQAAKLLKSLNVERSKQFEVKFFLDEATRVAVPTGKVTPEERNLAQKFASIGQGLYTANSGLSTDDIRSADELNIKLEFFVDSIEKEAADEKPQQGQNAQQAGPANPTAPQSGRPGFMDMAAKQTPVAKDTQELIDLLTYYSLGKFRGDEAGEVLTKLEESLKEAESHLCKILLLTQLGRVPGHQYSDVKVLLSDMDSYISSIVSSRVLLRSGVS
jgi:hypothetical protein